ncbi:MAG: YdeI/OmpD-associated family protein [Emticicia sp.]|uniref:YdeI/OmpD-associated family protein n=1 Tax=Emticicia sp. TaxID=1930953 RepID=UPI003BA760B1
MQNQEIEIFYPTSVSAWREWLEQNHTTQQSIWLMYYTKKSGKPTISWSEAVDVALCYGWIDSKHVKIDTETSRQYFTKRKAKSTWSRVNKDKIEQLIADGLMTEAGLKSVEIAKQNGSWTLLDSIEALEIPEILELAFSKNEGSKQKFQAQSKSKQKLMLYGLKAAKTIPTQEKRIREIIDALSN